MPGNSSYVLWSQIQMHFSLGSKVVVPKKHKGNNGKKTEKAIKNVLFFHLRKTTWQFSGCKTDLVNRKSSLKWLEIKIRYLGRIRISNNSIYLISLCISYEIQLLKR